MQMTLLELLKEDGIKTRRIGKTYRARCPFHNGKTATSLSIDPQKGLYFCHGCGKTGDAIQWLRDYRGLSFQEACLELGREPSLKPLREHREDRPKPSPSLKWQQKAGAFLAIAQGALKTNRAVLGWLRGRGLRDETIKAAGLGWNPRTRYDDRETWGLEPLQDEKGKKKALWLPSGLAIPLIEKGRVLRLRIRRPSGEPRYVIVSGSDTKPMTWNLNRGAVVIVESELDGLLIEQEAGELAGVVVLGTVTVKPDQELNGLLKRASSILISIDFDEAGARAAWQYWLKTYPNAKRWPTPYGKDPTEAMQKGLNIRAWLEAGLTPGTFTERSQGSAEAIIKPFPKEWLQKYVSGIAKGTKSGIGGSFVNRGRT
jgi:DNA primase